MIYLFIYLFNIPIHKSLKIVHFLFHTNVFVAGNFWKFYCAGGFDNKEQIDNRDFVHPKKQPKIKNVKLIAGSLVRKTNGILYGCTASK